MAKKKAKKVAKKKVVKKTGIDKKRWSLAAALWWGGAVLILGLLANFTGYGTVIVNLLGTVYRGYDPTVFGTLIGTVWALVDMFVGVYILIWLYEGLEKVLP